MRQLIQTWAATCGLNADDLFCCRREGLSHRSGSDAPVARMPCHFTVSNQKQLWALMHIGEARSQPVRYRAGLLHDDHAQRHGVRAEESRDLIKCSRADGTGVAVFEDPSGFSIAKKSFSLFG